MLFPFPLKLFPFPFPFPLIAQNYSHGNPMGMGFYIMGIMTLRPYLFIIWGFYLMGIPISMHTSSLQTISG